MASTADEALAAVSDSRVQIIVTDYVFDHTGDGLQLIGRIRRQRPDLGIIVYSMITSPPIITDILMAGANAFVPKTEGIDAVSRACRRFLSRKTSQSTTGADGHAELDGGALQRLSPREREVMRLIARGMSVREIGVHLRRSPKTVSAQKCTAMAKLGLRGDIALARYLAQRGWLD
ncbi:Transcriptional regulatory protein RcsB [compost metagenome]